MASFRDLLAVKLAEEASEHAMHDAVEGALRRAADKGESGKNIAKSGLHALFSDASPIMRTARSMLGFVPRAAYPVVATVGATAIAKWAEDFLPGDNRPGIKEARFILKNVAPHLVIGAAEGFGEVASQIDQQVDAVRSDSTTPDPIRNRQLDIVVVADMFPDRIFIPVRGSDGSITTNSDGTPVVEDNDFVTAQRLWDQTHRAMQRAAGEGRNRRMEVVPAVPFQCQLVPLQVAIARVNPDRARKGDLDAIKAMLKKPGSWGATLSTRAKDLLLALSVTRSKKGPLEQTLAEDFFKDLPNKGDVALIEHLAERFDARRQADGSFSDTDFDAIVAFVDDWLGAELSWWSKLQRSCARIWRNRGSISHGTSFALKAGLFGIVAATIAVVLLFVSMFGAIVWGMTADLTQPMLGYADPRWPAAALVFIGAWVIVVLLFLLRPLQGLLSPITKIFGASELWLTSFGFKFSLLIAPFGFLIPLAILTGASFYARFLIVGIPLLAIGSGMAFKAAGVPSMAQLLTIRGAKYGWIGGLIIIAVDWFVRNVPWSAVGEAIVSAWTFVVDSQVLSSVLLFAITLTLGHLLIVRTIERTKYRSGNEVIVDVKTSWFARMAVIAIALAVASLPWLKSGRHEFDPFAPKPVVTETLAQAPAPSIQHPVSVPSGGHRHSDKLNCSALSPEGREAVGCK
ncbi:hypothetical protein HY771_00505 [Candidatus Uhrbacteria bacterium]|nr:hypothetical protein [Candidatus Uhrbacteria bacterium]